MAIYDKAHELAKSIKESTEFLEYKKLKEELFSNPELKAKIEDFEKIRYEVQMLTVKNRQPKSRNRKPARRKNEQTTRTIPNINRKQRCKKLL